MNQPKNMGSKEDKEAISDNRKIGSSKKIKPALLSERTLTYIVDNQKTPDLKKTTPGTPHGKNVKENSKSLEDENEIGDKNLIIKRRGNQTQMANLTVPAVKKNERKIKLQIKLKKTNSFQNSDNLIYGRTVLPPLKHTPERSDVEVEKNTKYQLEKSRGIYLPGNRLKSSKSKHREGSKANEICGSVSKVHRDMSGDVRPIGGSKANERYGSVTKVHGDINGDVRPISSYELAHEKFKAREFKARANLKGWHYNPSDSRHDPNKIYEYKTIRMYLAMGIEKLKAANCAGSDFSDIQKALSPTETLPYIRNLSDNISNQNNSSKDDSDAVGNTDTGMVDVSLNVSAATFEELDSSDLNTRVKSPGVPNKSNKKVKKQPTGIASAVPKLKTNSSGLSQTSLSNAQKAQTPLSPKPRGWRIKKVLSPTKITTPEFLNVSRRNDTTPEFLNALQRNEKQITQVSSRGSSCQVSRNVTQLENVAEEKPPVIPTPKILVEAVMDSKLSTQMGKISGKVSKSPNTLTKSTLAKHVSKSRLSNASVKSRVSHKSFRTAGANSRPTSAPDGSDSQPPSGNSSKMPESVKRESSDPGNSTTAKTSAQLTLEKSNDDKKIPRGFLLSPNLEVEALDKKPSSGQAKDRSVETNNGKTCLERGNDENNEDNEDDGDNNNDDDDVQGLKATLPKLQDARNSPKPEPDQGHGATTSIQRSLRLFKI